jgi:Secretion system C-terminal sorting domain
MGYWSYGYFMQPLLDGSYAVVATDPTQYGRINQNLFRFDYKVYRVTAGGAVLDSAWVGTAAAWESPFQVKATTDGGLLICGFESPYPASNPRRGTLLKLDSAFQQQWKYTIYAPTGDAETGAEIHDAWETAAGRFIIQGGGDTIATMLREILPPLQPGQPATMGWGWGFPLAPLPVARGPRYYEYGSDQIAYGFGGYYADFNNPVDDVDFYQCRLTGLPAPAVLDYCRRPPSRPVASMGALVGDSIRFTVDATRQTAGPRYAEISLVEWDFGDGTPRQQGWDVWHRFATPTPVAVRLRLCNNLSCCRDSVFYPFGRPVGLPPVAAPPAVSVFPNPSASGHFTVQTSAAATGAQLTVLDATGRTVWRGAASEAQTRVDLSRHPGGVYLLRLTWPDGRAVSKKLLR